MMTLKKWTNKANLLFGENNVRIIKQNGKIFTFVRISSKLPWEVFTLPWWYDTIGFLGLHLRRFFK